MISLLSLLGSLAAGASAGLFVPLLADRLARILNGARKVEMDEILGDPTLCFAFLALLGAVFSAAVSIWLLPFCLAVAWLLSRRMPALLEKRGKQELRSACDGQLDVLADIVAMGVRAGLSFDAALDIYLDKFDGELSREMRSARLSWKNGMVSRERALHDLSRRIDSRALKRFAETVVQAIRYGSPLANMLAEFAEDLRKERYDSIERQVAKAPVKMLIPTAVCILPAMLILVMGPVLIQFMQSGI